MSFIRIKKRVKGDKRYRFAYEVENKWYKRKKATRQKVKRYLGRVFRIEQLISPPYEDFLQYLGVDSEGFGQYCDRVHIEEMSLDLVEFTLFNFGFKQGVGRQKNRLILDDFMYDTLKKRLYSISTKKPVVLELNEGFLCDLSIRQMLRFNPNKFEENHALGTAFAKIMLATGIFIKPDVFVELFDILQKEKVKERPSE